MDFVDDGPIDPGEAPEMPKGTAPISSPFPATPAPAEADEGDVKLELDNCSLSSELECPVCYQLFVEPVRAACDRHTFCKNCLLRSQQCSGGPRCPICRAESVLDAAELPEVIDLVEKLRQIDEQYDARVKSARQERKEHLQNIRIMRAPLLHDSQPNRTFLVNGAGSAEVNGMYVACILPTYVGPTAYRKPSTCMFIFRWHQVQWVIAEVRGPTVWVTSANGFTALPHETHQRFHQSVVGRLNKMEALKVQHLRCTL